MNEEIRLGDVAEVMRCQVKRQRIETSVMALQGISLGRQPGGHWVAMEIGIDRIGRETRFLPEMEDCVVLRLTRRSEKFLIRRNDILMTCIGMRGRLGLVAFAALQPDCSVTDRNLCQIRAHYIDPAWLFFRLIEQDAIDYMREKARGDRIYTVSMDDIRDFVFDAPSKLEIAEARKAHEKIMASDEIIRRETAKIRDERQGISTMFAIQNQMKGIYIREKQKSC